MEPPTEITSDVIREAVKEGLSEWMDQRWTKLGQWSAAGLATTILTGLAYVVLRGFGWHR